MTGRLLTVVLLAMVTVTIAGCRTDIQSGIDRANDLLYRKQYVDSDRLYRKLLKRLEMRGELTEAEDAQRLIVLDRLGKINALYLHDYSQAISYLQTLVRLYPKTDQAFAARATVADIYHHKLADLQAAIDAYQKLVSDFPDRSDSRRAQLQIANAYFQLKNYDQARTEAEALINRAPKSDQAMQARFHIANSYYVQARYAEAIATYEGLLEEKPEQSLASLVLFELGNCFQGLDQSDRALAYYYACLQDHPDPILVQRKIRRVRMRIHKTRPLPEIYLPEYLKTRLAAARRTSGITRSRPRRVVESPAEKPAAAVSTHEPKTEKAAPTESAPSVDGAKTPTTPEKRPDAAAPAPKPAPAKASPPAKPEPKPASNEAG